MFLQMYLLDLLNHIDIWQVSLQLSCRDTCQTSMWYETDKQCSDNRKLIMKTNEEKIG